MDEQEFDSFTRFRPFRIDDATRALAQAHRNTALGMALWGKTSEDLRRQLAAPHPEIPSGFELADFRELEKSIRTVTAVLNRPRHNGLSSWSALRAFYSPMVEVGTERLTALEAKSEIIRRAIEYLENR